MVVDDDRPQTVTTEVVGDHWASLPPVVRSHRKGSSVVRAPDDPKADPPPPGELIVIPQGTWHRFESPEPVKVVTFTPQPTDHQVVRPT